ncbi:MAG TPA: FlgT C-terminal domain-containing protein [Methylomirabilota bacterium]|nr:FlgT C-terminal domain-containing protein [Methylomirabilota bacterium]
MKAGHLVGLLVALLVVTGCNTVRQLFGIPTSGEPTINLKSAETRWLLIKNPRFGDVRSEPEYTWVEEDKLPTTITTLVRGKGAIIAPPEIVAKHGPPPGGGKISPRQGVPYQTPDAPRTTVADPRAGGSASAPAAGAGRAATPAPPAPEPPKRGLVVHVDASRIVIDLTSADGVRPGTVLSLRRDRIPIVHPVTGEVLGELDDEVATARVTETRERFSVAEIQSVAAGAQVQVKDRVVLK